jgi:cytoskeleton protein RodZ
VIRNKRSRRSDPGAAVPALERPAPVASVQPEIDVRPAPELEGVTPPPGGLDLAQIGRALREARERTGQPVEVIADALCIRPAYLSALERGDANALPGRTYALGFIRAYAASLGLRADRVVEEARIALDRVPAMRRYAPPREAAAPPRTLGLGLVAVLALVGLAGWALLAARTPGEPDATAVAATETTSNETTAVPAPVRAPAVRESSAIAPSGVDAPSPTVVDAAPATSTPPANPDVAPPAVATPQLAAADVEAEALPAGTRVVLEAIEPAWIQVRSPDRAFVHTGTLQAGQRFEVPDRTDLALWTGNAGGLVVRVDGQALPPLGPSGGVVRQFALDPERLLAATAGRP